MQGFLIFHVFICLFVCLFGGGTGTGFGSLLLRDV
jgi:hypothetical protein